jgi:hypothetical protein
MSFKRIIALVLSLLMVFGAAASVFAAEAEETAAATTEEVASPYVAAVKSLMAIGAKNGKNGIFKGLENGDLDLDSDVSRWQMALFVSRILTGETDDSYWGKVTVSSSIFTDIEEGSTASNYLGAIGYASQKGVIVGWKDATSGKDVFGPENGIKYQDALTMCTRALGFNGLAYPWGNIEKAIDLGLTKGIVDVGYEDELTRGEVAQVLYNTLIAYTVDAKTGERTNLLKSVFGVVETTVVIVASEDVIYDATNNELDRDNYVSFSELDLKTGKPLVNAEGKVIVYSLAKGNFGIDATNLAVGDSYFVTTYDNFQSLVICEKLDTKTLWNIGAKQIEFKTETFNTEKFAQDLSSRPYSKVVIVNPKDEKDNTNNYRIVGDYTYLNNTQGSVSGLEPIAGDFELLTYDPSQPEVFYKVGTKFYIDFFNNIYSWSKDGNGIVTSAIKYWYNVHTDSYNTKVVVNNPNGTVVYEYKAVTMADIEKDASVYYADATRLIKNNFKQIMGLDKPAYSSLKLLNDGGADDYDRAFYKSYGLMKYVEYSDEGSRVKLIYNNDGAISSGLNDKYFEKVSTADFAKNYTIVNAEDYTEMKFDLEKDRDGNNCKFFIGYYNWQTRTIEVLRTLEVKQGILKGWNGGAKSITVNNEVFPANYSSFKHSAVLFNDDTTVANANLLHSWYNRNVRYIVVDGQIVYIEDDTKPELGVIVLDEFIGYVANGNAEFYAYTAFEPGARRRIQLSTINGWYSNFANTYGYTTETVINLLGESMNARRDSNGIYYLDYVAKRGTTKLNFGMYGNGVFEDKINVMTNVGADGTQDVKTINATANTYFVFVIEEYYDNNRTYAQHIITSTGVPQVGAWIKGDFTYVNPAMVIVHLEDIYDFYGFNTSEQITFVYIPSNYVADIGTTGTNASNLPYVTYNGLYDIKTGNTGSFQVVNQMLVNGKIYMAVDGVISGTYVGSIGLHDSEHYLFQETIGYWNYWHKWNGVGSTSTFANGFPGMISSAKGATFQYAPENTLWAWCTSTAGDNAARRNNFISAATPKILADLIANAPAMYTPYTHFKDIVVKNGSSDYNKDFDFTTGILTNRPYEFSYVYDIKTQKLVIYVTGVHPLYVNSSILNPFSTNTNRLFPDGTMLAPGYSTISYAHSITQSVSVKEIKYVSDRAITEQNVYKYTATDAAFDASLSGIAGSTRSYGYMVAADGANYELGLARVKADGGLDYIDSTVTATAMDTDEDGTTYHGIKFNFTLAHIINLPVGEYVITARFIGVPNSANHFQTLTPNEFYYFTVK